MNPIDYIIAGSPILEAYTKINAINSNLRRQMWEMWFIIKEITGNEKQLV